jgi:hypothetical protein
MCAGCTWIVPSMFHIHLLHVHDRIQNKGAPHPVLNPVVQVLDRKIFGRYPRALASYLDILCLYFVVRKDQSSDWVRNAELTEAHEAQLVKDFEKSFSRSEVLPCNPVRDYKRIMAGDDPSRKVQNLEDGVADDVLDLVAFTTVDEHFGATA